MGKQIKFQKYYVTDGVIKARISYSLDNHVIGKPVVTLYAKDYSGNLGMVFSAEYKNDTDCQTDYFEKGLVNLFEGHPLYAAARVAAVRKQEFDRQRYAAKYAKAA